VTDDLSAWLDERLKEAPPSLAAEIRRALHVARCTLHDLEAAAESLMREAQSTAGSRAGALTLLAADALTTLAHERAAPRSPLSAPRD
jgi:hypothetical protein